ncbi:hypothetical protein Lal_00039195 [Lupinus albus]|nr:hypothetical protein Lal_00039195 [Lupinus albus]
MRKDPKSGSGLLLCPTQSGSGLLLCPTRSGSELLLCPTGNGSDCCEIDLPDVLQTHSYNLFTRRTYKHRTDLQTAPTDEPEPTAPNQPESLAPSSSTAAMPTNQMIMDELVSLRGYITTRMDAFDIQNQQIHYELHRLSSRLSNMDVDEDSSEPES